MVATNTIESLATRTNCAICGKRRICTITITGNVCEPCMKELPTQSPHDPDAPMVYETCGQWTRHPLSAYWPDMLPKQFEELIEDIRTNGQIEPIMIYQDMVLDGWNRVKVCVNHLGIDPEWEEYANDSTSPNTYVISKNAMRRHIINPSQKLMAILACAQWRDTGVTNGSPKAQDTLTNEQIADSTNVSKRTVQRAKTVAQESPEGAERIRQGETTVGEEYKAVRPPQERETVFEPETETPTTPDIVIDTANGMVELITVCNAGQGYKEVTPNTCAYCAEHLLHIAELESEIRHYRTEGMEYRERIALLENPS